MSTARTVLVVAGSLAWMLGGSSQGCAARSQRPHDGIRSSWSDYRELARHRAFAIAGAPDRAWVGARVGGYETSRGAQAAALAECAKQRRDRRFQAPCRIYALDDEIVW